MRKKNFLKIGVLVFALTAAIAITYNHSSVLCIIRFFDKRI